AEGSGDFRLLQYEQKVVQVAFTPSNSAVVYSDALHIDSNDNEAPYASIILHGANVIIRIWSRVFIPYISVRAPTGKCYQGDNRGFQPTGGTLLEPWTSRLEQWIEFDLGNLNVLDNDMGAGTTYEIYCAPPAYYTRGGTPLVFASAQQDKACMSQSVNEE